VFNDAVAARRKAYAERLAYPSTAVLDKQLITRAKRTPERAWLAEVSTVPLQQALSRKAGGSANRAKARLRVAKIHEKIRHRRDDWLYKQVKTLTGENQALYVEDLNVAGLARGRSAKSIHDAALGRFLHLLESKAARAGRVFVRVDRFFPSTQLCSSCGALTGPKGVAGLSVRGWVCPCGAVHDRDANAEINIRREGQRLVAAGLADT
jgi:putative transposase